MNSDEMKPLPKRMRTLRPRSKKIVDASQTSTKEPEIISIKLPYRESEKGPNILNDKLIPDAENVPGNLTFKDDVSNSEISDVNTSHTYRNLFPTFSGSERLGSENSIQELPKSFERIVSDSRNIIHYLSSVTRTISHPIKNKKFLESLSVRNFSSLLPCCKRSPFGRRVTSMTCHPSKANLFAAASKGGELALFDMQQNFELVRFKDGIGAGGSVVALKFHPHNPTAVYTAAITGKVRCQDFFRGEDEVLIDTGTWSNWFCSLDVLPEKKLLAAGDCCGITYLMSDNSNKVITKTRMHKRKVTNIECCEKSQNLLLTCSTDKTAKLWDIRKLSDTPLHTFNHDKGVNSAYFNQSCTSILTTDQNLELSVYSRPWWTKELSIRHPHRHFQHLTPIKAVWHPCVDAIVVGRYPDKNFLHSDSRTIDFYDGHTGVELYRTACSDVPGITSLNVFNSGGDILVSGSGYNVIFWRMRDIDIEDTQSSRQHSIELPRQAQPKKMSRKSVKLQK